MESLPVGQVVLAAFPFSDLTTRKVRPCLVVGLAEFDDVILCQITSRSYKSQAALDLKRGDFKQGSIITDSFIRPDKIATVARVRISRTLGKITDSKLVEVKQKLAQIFELTEVTTL